jgi:hypothetical protein
LRGEYPILDERRNVIGSVGIAKNIDTWVGLHNSAGVLSESSDEVGNIIGQFIEIASQLIKIVKCYKKRSQKLILNFKKQTRSLSQ